MQLVAAPPHVRSYTPQHVRPRTHARLRRTFGALVLLAGAGMLVVGWRAFLARSSAPVLDGQVVGSVADFVAPLALAAVMVSVGVHLMRRPIDRVF